MKQSLNAVWFRDCTIYRETSTCTLKPAYHKVRNTKYTRIASKGGSGITFKKSAKYKILKRSFHPQNYRTTRLQKLRWILN